MHYYKIITLARNILEILSRIFLLVNRLAITHAEFTVPRLA